MEIDLFEPLIIRGLKIEGRIIKTATSETRASPDGFMTDEYIAFYEPMARAGTPLIITGNIFISRDGQSTPCQLGAERDDRIEGLRRFTDSVHQYDSRIFAQLSHCGRQVLPVSVGLEQAVSASDVKDLVTGTRPRPLTIEEIRTIVRQFGEAAQRCQAAGFDGIQIHAGHGYLVSQFLTPYTNRRKDEYGGTFENRMRILSEIHAAIREWTGPEYPVIIKLNGSDSLPLRHGLKPRELVEIALLMEQQGIDAVEVSIGHYESGFPVVRGHFWRCLRAMVRGSVRQLPLFRRTVMTLFWPLIAPVFNLLWPPRQGFNLAFAREFKARLKVPVICVGGFYKRVAMENAIRNGDCDAVSMGRAVIADPLLARHLREGTHGPQCVYCNACVGHIGSRGLDCEHPRVRREKDTMLAEVDKTVRVS